METTRLQNNPSNLSPSNPPAQSQADILAACQAMILQSIIDSSEAKLNEANQSLENQVRLGKRKGMGHEKLLDVNAAPSAAKTGGAGDPTQTNYTAEAYSIICQMDNAEQSLAQGRITQSYFNLIMGFDPGLPGLYNKLQDVAAKITDPNSTALLQKVITYFKNPNPTPDWTTFITNSGILLQIGQWLGNTEKSMNTDLSSTEDQMNLMQIMVDLIQNPASGEVKGKTLDQLFFGQGVDIYQTVVAYFVTQAGGSWVQAAANISVFLKMIPAPSTASPSTTPEYDKFVQGLQDAVTKSSWPYTATPEVILNDGFGFSSAWVVFRTGGPVTNPNYILFGEK